MELFKDFARQRRQLRLNRRRFLSGLGITGAVSLSGIGCAGTSRSVNSPPASATIGDLQKDLEAGRTTSRQLTLHYLRRIEALDKNGPELRSILTINPDALSLADDADRARKSGQSRGALHGIPILLKDNIDTADRMPTTAGSLALEGTIAPRDAWVTGRLREAGAILLGKTNLSEWANIRSPRSSSGWSGLGGQTRNPYALSRSPSGSSSGSAAAVAANLAVAAIGTETDGSIVSPSSCCSLVGLKPTVGLVSRSGIIPIAHSQDTAGPMARTVFDVAVLLSAIAGEDPGDPATAHAAGHVHKDYTRFLDRDALRGRRIGVARQEFGGHPEVTRLIEKQLDVLRDLGAELVDPVNLATQDKFGDAEFEVLLYELKADLAAYLATRGDTVSVHSLRDVIDFNERHAERELAIFGQETFLKAEAKGPLTDPAYLEARAQCVRLARVEGIEATMAKHRLDALVAPTEGAPPWLIDHVNGDHYGGGCSSFPAVSGCPHLTVPAGYARGLPVGISFFGRAWSEPELLSFGYAYEQATRAWREPSFLREV